MTVQSLTVIDISLTHVHYNVYEHDEHERYYFQKTHVLKLSSIVILPLTALLFLLGKLCRLYVGGD